MSTGRLQTSRLRADEGSVKPDARHPPATQVGFDWPQTTGWVLFWMALLLGSGLVLFMREMLKTGDTIPEFTFDTPYTPGHSFYALAEERPVCLVFMSNFGHPISRHYLSSYLNTFDQLNEVDLVCVVRTRPEVLSGAVPQGALPFTLMCDPDSVLSDYLAIPQTTNKLKAFSVQALKIVNEAKKQGYEPPENEVMRCPLTLIVGPQGKVLFAHYGNTLTDMPEHCGAISAVAEQVLDHARAEGLLPTEARPGGKLAALENQDLPPERKQELEDAMGLLFGTDSDSE